MPTRSSFDIWREQALALPAGDYKLKQPLFVLVGESHDLAAQTRKHWKTRYNGKKEILAPGLDLAGEKQLPRGIEQEILTLSDAVQQAQSAYLLAVSPASKQDLSTEAEELVSEIQSVLEWHFNDGVEDEQDAKLASLIAEHEGDPFTPDALASELDDYATLAAEHRSAIRGLGGFDEGDLDRAVELARLLRDLPTAANAPEREATRQALDLRNRLAWLLQQKLAQVRAAARFVFRHQPDTARSFASTYERKKRAAARRSRKKSPSDPSDAPPAKPGESPR